VKARAAVAHAFGMSMLDMRALTISEYVAMIEVLSDQAERMRTR
jgi:hypothetical protein